MMWTGPNLSTQSSTRIGVMAIVSIVLMMGCGTSNRQTSSGSASASSSSTTVQPTTVQPTTVQPTVSPAGLGAIGGVVTAGPTCPVATPDRPCAPKPVVARITAVSTDGQTVASADSDANGTYRLSVPAGTYVLQVSGGTFSRCAPVQITVAATLVSANISCDTGIR